MEEEDVRERDAKEGQETRRLQELTGGKFCPLTVSNGTVAFADPTCVPEAPVRDILREAETDPKILETGRARERKRQPEEDVEPETGIRARERHPHIHRRWTELETRDF